MKPSRANAQESPLPTLKERKQQAVREVIWDAAINLFLERGFDATTVDEVAQAAGISPRSFFRYFGSKADLMGYAMVIYGGQITAAIDACPRSYSLHKVFRETVFGVARDAAGHPRSRKIMQILSNSPAAAAAEMSRLAEVQEVVAGAFARRLPAGSKSALTATVLAGVTLQVTGVTVRWCYQHAQADASKALEQVFAALDGLFRSAQ